MENPIYTAILAAANSYDFEKDDYDDMSLYALQQVEGILQIMSKSAQESLSEAFGSRFSYDDELDILMLDEPYYASFCEAAIFFLIITCDSMSRYINPEDCGLNKWESLEDNDWEWFRNELIDYGLIYDDKFHFLLEINNIDSNSETQCFAVVTTKTRAEADLALIKFAQAFHDGQYDEDRGGFFANDVLNQDCSTKELSEQEATFMGSIVRQFSSVEDIPANMSEVELHDNYEDIMSRQ